MGNGLDDAKEVKTMMTECYFCRGRVERSKVDVDFRVTFFDQLVVVPRGGSTRQFEIAVKPK